MPLLRSLDDVQPYSTAQLARALHEAHLSDAALHTLVVEDRDDPKRTTLMCVLTAAGLYLVRVSRTSNPLRGGSYDPRRKKRQGKASLVTLAVPWSRVDECVLQGPSFADKLQKHNHADPHRVLEATILLRLVETAGDAEAEGNRGSGSGSGGGGGGGGASGSGSASRDQDRDGRCGSCGVRGAESDGVGYRLVRLSPLAAAWDVKAVVDAIQLHIIRTLLGPSAPPTLLADLPLELDDSNAVARFGDETVDMAVDAARAFARRRQERADARGQAVGGYGCDWAATATAATRAPTRGGARPRAVEPHWMEAGTESSASNWLDDSRSAKIGTEGSEWWVVRQDGVLHRTRSPQNQSQGNDQSVSFHTPREGEALVVVEGADELEDDDDEEEDNVLVLLLEQLAALVEVDPGTRQQLCTTSEGSELLAFVFRTLSTNANAGPERSGSSSGSSSVDASVSADASVNSERASCIDLRVTLASIRLLHAVVSKVALGDASRKSTKRSRPVASTITTFATTFVHRVRP